MRGSAPPQLLTYPFVKLVPDDDWYQLSYFGPGRNHELYVDVTTTAQWTTPTLVQAVDLDLDVLRRGDGETEVLDRHEFDLHRVRLRYPDDVVERAEATLAEVLDAVRARRPPFDGVAEDWLRRYLAG
ncbi:MAG: DUF402 domain-containing protein [Actinomycetota bacterium]|nr:DUF402 domain-containing protein [Actinomycetota bacterium]